MKSPILLSNLLISAVIIFPISCNAKPQWEDYRGGTHFVIEVESKGDVRMDGRNTKIIADILNARLEELGIKKRIVKIVENNKIAVQIPPVKNAKLLASLISYSSILEFRLVDDNIKGNEFKPSEKQSMREVLCQSKKDPQTGQNIMVPFVTETENILRIGEYVKNAKATNENGGQDLVTIQLTDEGARLFEDFTANHIGRRLAIVLNNKIYSVPIIKEKVSGGRIQIAGHFSKEEASDLSIVLRAGFYPAHTKLIKFKELTKDSWLGSAQD